MFMFELPFEFLFLLLPRFEFELPFMFPPEFEFMPPMSPLMPPEFELVVLRLPLLRSFILSSMRWIICRCSWSVGSVRVARRLLLELAHVLLMILDHHLHVLAVERVARERRELLHVGLMLRVERGGQRPALARSDLHQVLVGLRVVVDHLLPELPNLVARALLRGQLPELNLLRASHGGLHRELHVRRHAARVV